jgi:hypothetical protein
LQNTLLLNFSIRPTSPSLKAMKRHPWHLPLCAILIGTYASCFCTLILAQTPAVPYDIVYVRQARYGDNTNTTWPEVFHPARIDPGADLMLLHPNGTEEILEDCTNGSVTDPFISFDGQWCYYVLFPDVRLSQSNYQRDYLPYAGCDIWRIHLQSRQKERLTFQEWTPNNAAGKWTSDPVNAPSDKNRLGYGIINLGPCPLPGGKIIFSSNRNGFVPTKPFTTPALQLFVMDADGKNVEFTGRMNFGSALHPTIMRDGRVMFSSYESQGLRDERAWGLWSIYPDGRNFEPLLSAFYLGEAFHFMTQLSSGDLVIVNYYNLNNNGFGSLLKFPVHNNPLQPAFHDAFMTNAPYIVTGAETYTWNIQFPFEPKGIHSITPFTTGEDNAAPPNPAGGPRVGKFTHPSAAPNNDLLVVWTPGPANDLNRPTTIPYYDGGLYVIKGGGIINSPSQLVTLKNDPNYNEAWPRAVVSYRAVHGIEEPKKLPWLPNDGTVDPALPAGTPYALIGSSSFYKRESFPGWTLTPGKFDGLDVFNTTQNDQSPNWFIQGADAGKYTNSEIHAVRILAMEPNSHRSYGPQEGQKFYSHANERLRIMGEIPLRKKNAQGQTIIDPEGNPDTSFLAKIPADTPFTFQTINQDGIMLNMAQTWHQVRAGEKRVNCGGCHAHSQQPLDFNSTAAGQAGYALADLVNQTPMLTKNAQNATVVVNQPAGTVNVEFFRDIRPILQSKCTSCHNAAHESKLNLSDTSTIQGSNGTPSLPGDYRRLALDPNATWGHKAVINGGIWRQMNASRYIRKFQSRRSLLMWKIMGQRLDGWTNSSHPTETTPGDASTLPAGANRNDADLDYTGTIMPPPNSSVAPLTADEKMTIARWIDLGCPINFGQMESPQAGAYGWFLDENRPTLSISSPRPNMNPGPLSTLRVSVADAYTGVKSGSLSIKANFSVNGRSAGSELADLATQASSGVYSISLNPALQPSSTERLLTCKVEDNQGNVTECQTRFWVVQDKIEVKEVSGERMGEQRFRLRFADAKPDRPHRIRYSSSLTQLGGPWAEAQIISEAWTHKGECWAEVAVPAGAAQRCFFVVERE